MAADRASESHELLRAARGGEKQAMDDLFSLAYDELRRLARSVRRGRGMETLNTTSLVHETYLKLLPSGGLPAKDRAHLKRLLARAMRQVLVDAARRKTAQKRSGVEITITLNQPLRPEPLEAAGLIDLDRALRELQEMDARRAAVVECRFFGGLDVEETAAAIGVSTATVKRDWRVARAWLAQAVSE